MSYPIEHFENIEELKSCASYWIKKLFLEDWTIQILQEPYKSSKLNESMGITHINWVDKAALIYIVDTSSIENVEEYTQRICEELILVHELLHLKWECKCTTLENNEDINIIYHSNLEQMAKSLLMVKYDINFNYFKTCVCI